MSLLELPQSLPASLNFVAVDQNTGNLHTGLVDTDLSVQYLKFGDTAYTTKTLVPASITEIGLGVYKINFTAAELDRLGTFLYVVNGQPSLSPQIRQYINEVLIGPDPAASYTPPVVPGNLITGTCIDLEGNPLVNIPVTAKMLEVPALINGVAVGASLVSTVTDANGFFQLNMIQGATVDVIIADLQYRRTFVVPANGTDDLFDIP